jgi:hypothetical protein
MEISSADEFLVPVWSQLGKRVYSGEEKYTLVSPGVSQGFGFTQRNGHVGNCGVFRRYRSAFVKFGAGLGISPEMAKCRESETTILFSIAVSHWFRMKTARVRRLFRFTCVANTNNRLHRQIGLEGG